MERLKFLDWYLKIPDWKAQPNSQVLASVHLPRGDNEDSHGSWPSGARGGGVPEWLTWRYAPVPEDVPLSLLWNYGWHCYRLLAEPPIPETNKIFPKINLKFELKQPRNKFDFTLEFKSKFYTGILTSQDPENTLDANWTTDINIS